MAKISSDSSEDGVKRAMLEREARMNPASVEPGMDDEWGDSGGDSWGSDDSWGSGGGDDSWGSGGAGGGGDSWGSGGGGWGDSNNWGSGGDAWGSSPTMQQPQQPNIEDKVFDGALKGAKGFGSFIKEIVKSFKTFDGYKKMVMGQRCVVTSIILAIVGVITLLFGKKFGIDLIVGSLISLGGGIPLYMFGKVDFENSGGQIPTQDNNTDNSSGMEEDWGSPSGSDGWSDDEFDTDDVDMFDEDDEEEEDLWGVDDDDEEDYITIDSEEEDMQPDKNAILDTIEDGNSFVTKAYLHEKIVEFLPYHNPNFSNEKDLEDTRTFELLCSAVSESGEQLRTGKQEDSPYLISAIEKLFYIDLEIKRVKWIKNIDKFVEEIVNIYKYHSELGNNREGIYGTGQAVGDKIYIKIMKGETAMVTVNDIYKVVSSEIKGNKYKMPIVIGIDIEGNPVVQDFWSINSILVTGMPRSGKSWFVQVVLAQMTFYMNPKDLNFYIFDPKGDISDFRDMTMPHVRKFVSTEANMLNELRHIVKVEGPRRKKILGDKGFVNINDFKKKHPDFELPILYIMIDEVVTLAENMDKETKDEFQSLLLVLVSQLPALGIRIIMVPHVVKDQVIKKSTTDLIPCRISVRGDAEHIESSTGTKPKDFQQKLTHQGDMAVRFNNDPTKFVHSAILTTSNEGNSELFDFLTKLWCKIEPDSYKGSYAEQKAMGKEYSNVGVTANTTANSGNSNSNSSNVNVPKRQVTMNVNNVIDETEVHNLLDGVHSKDKGVSSYEEQEDFWR